MLNTNKLNENKIVFILLIYLFIFLTPLKASGNRDSRTIDLLVKSCYKSTESCDLVLNKIHSYQKNAAVNKNFACQTRLLGLEANLIMVMNSNFKEKEAESIIQAVKKYC